MKRKKEQTEQRKEKRAKRQWRYRFKATEYAPSGICLKNMLELQSYGTFIHCIAK